MVLLASVFLAMLVASAGAVDFRANGFAPTLTSVVNKVPDFYAEGTSGDYSLKISPKGGYLASSGTTMNLMPWGYVTTQWSLGTVYIIFLANVTKIDFHIGFLYLTNSSSPFILRTLEYQGGSLRTLTFEGIQYMFTRTTTTASIPMPNLKLEAKAQTNNDLSAIGSELYINGNSGQMLNASMTLRIFPLRVQFFQAPNDYNELWSLLSDDVGNYYFAVLYMQNSDPNHVTIEHQIRLNDYQRLNGRTFEAKWTKGPFAGRLTIRLPISNSTVKVDGFPFRTDSRGVASIYVPNGATIVEVPDEITQSGGTKLRFSSWSNHGKANPLDIEVQSALDLTAKYNTQYLLTVESQYGEPQGSGWYDQGTNATFVVPDMITSANGTRRVFQQWSGDFSSQSDAGWLNMNAPKHVTATWKTQFEVKLQLVGPPANATAEIAVNGKAQLIGGSDVNRLWVDSNEKLTIEVQSTLIQGTTVNYNFTELRVDNQASGTDILVTKPITIAIIYSDHPKTQPTIGLEVNPDSTFKGQTVTVTGSIPKPSDSSTVNLSYGRDNMNWELLANVTVKSDGTFACNWKPNGTGTYFVKAFWAGDYRYVPASQVVSVHVLDASLPSLGGSNGFVKFVQDIIESAKNFSVLSALLVFAESLLLLGIAVAALFVPGGSLILGYFIGSLMVGFVYIFPVSAVILSVKAARSQRSPSVYWLTPLATIWVFALGMLVTDGAVFAAPPLLLEASAILLISSNALLTPLALSMILAKVVAR